MLADLSPARIEHANEKEKATTDSNNNAAESSSMERKSLCDVATLLELKGVVAEEEDEDDFEEDEEEDSEELLENSSSLESLVDVEDEFVVQGDDIRASSTSCSENSFEMSSTNSFVSTLNRNGDSGFEGTDTSERRRPSIEEERQSNTTTTDDEPMPSTSTMSSDMANPMAFLFEKRPVPTTSQSMNSFLVGNAAPRNPEKFQKMRESIDKEVNSLDTRLPSFDFEKLEKQLASAASERQMTERKFLGEQVRRRLAMQYEQYAGSSPAVHTRPLKSNLGHRLQSAMNLQVCYMNDLENDSSEEDEDEDDDRYVEESEDDEEDDLLGGVPKSKSAPNLKSRLEERSGELGANALAKASTSKERLEVLERETRVMLEKAKEAARMQMELERGPLASAEADAAVARRPKKLCRMQLSRMPVAQLRKMVDDLNRRIDVENSELVKLLIERDALHMEQDSTLVDIEDLIQHNSNLDSLNLPSFLVAEQNPPKKTATTAPKFRIFKR